MSNLNYISDLLNALDLSSVSSTNFLPSPYPGTDSCFRSGLDKYGRHSKFFHLVSYIKPFQSCPFCGASGHHESKGKRTLFLTHISNGHQRLILEVVYHRYLCSHCLKYFKDDIPFKFYDTMLTFPAAQACLIQMRENSSLASISRMMGVSASAVYRLFYKHIYVQHRFYHLRSVISIDEFKATTDKGTYAFNIVDPISGNTIDIIEDRKASSLRNYFTRFPFSERKKVKIIIMDLSNAFRLIMHSLFPNAKIICDRFHYVRLINDGLKRARLDFCSDTNNRPLAESIKRQLHLFDKYRKDLDNEKAWYDHHLKKHFTSKGYIDYIFDQPDTELFYETYKIYQKLLELIHEKHRDYKKELNNWLDEIFETDNCYYIKSAKNIRKNWFLPLLRSLTYKAKYRRHGKEYMTSFNNGFIESMNNKVKLVKRNAYGYKYFENLRKRILLHLKFAYKFV